jgi:hypothetical protein
MAKLSSELVVSLIDKVSGPAKGATAALGGLAKAEKSLAASGRAAKQWGDSFTDQLSRMRLSARELDSVGRSFERFEQQFRASGARMKASNYFGALDQWKTKVVADLNQVRAAADQAAAARDRMFKGWRGGARFALGAAGVGSLGFGAQRVLRGGARASAGNEREGARDYLAGMSSDETARLKGRSLALSSSFPSVDSQLMHESLRETAMSMRSIDKAFEIGDVIGRGLVVLQSLKGKEQAVEESRKFFKALDTLGKNIDPDQVRALYDGYVKALGVEGADLNMGDLMLIARRAKSAGPGLSNRFLMSTAPGLQGDMGADRLGTALGSEVAQIIGDRATKAAKAEQAKMGLRDGRGRFLDERKVMTDPDKYAWENLIPALQKRGIAPDDVPGVTKAMNSIFSNQLVADLFAKMITQREQYQGKSTQYEKAPGIGGAEALKGKDPYVALEGVFAQLRNSASILAEGPLARMVDLFNSLAGGIAAVNAKLANNPNLAEQAGWAAGGLGVAGAGAATWYSIRKAKAIADGLSMTRGALSLGSIGAEAAAAASPAATGATAAAAAAIASRAMTSTPYLAAIGGVIASPFVLRAATEADRGLTSGERLAKHRGGSMNDVLRRNFDEDRARLGIGPIGGAQSGTIDVFKQGAEGVKYLDVSAEAAAAGAKSGNAFKASLSGELQGAMSLIQQFVAQAQAALSFSASPTITPKISPVPNAAPGKASSLNDISAKQHAMLGDYGFKTV